ncbi:hypothetical protein KAS45_04890, partial [candidate division WOR-3 bacterium]|nr:hypothetical protein [candidate division WOR-3 bacterium]
QRYQWSSLPGYIKENKTVNFVNYDMTLNMVGGRRSYQRFIIDGLKKGLKNPLDNTKYQIILGSDSFMQRIKDTYTDKGSSREQPVYRKMKKRTIDPDIIINHVSEHLGLSRERILNRYHKGVARGITSELLYRFGALTLREIGNLLGVDYSSVYKSRCRLKAQMLKKKQIARIYKEIENKIKSDLSNV